MNVVVNVYSYHIFRIILILATKFHDPLSTRRVLHCFSRVVVNSALLRRPETS